MEFESTQEFRKNFTKVYHSEVSPMLEEFESQKNTVKKQIAIVKVVAVLFVLGLLWWNKFSINQAVSLFVIVTAMISLIIIHVLSWLFEKSLKKKIMPTVMKAFGDFTWSEFGSIDEYTIKESKLYTHFNRKCDGDNFYGTYKGLSVEVDETALIDTKRDSGEHMRTYTEFGGVLVQIDFKKNFKGHTIIRRRRLLNNKCYEEVKLEDPEFSKMYFVDGSDQIESRYILTTSFMERFKNIKNAFRASQMEASIKDSKILIAISTKRDLFKLGSLNRPINDTKQFTKMLNELVSIFDIIDELKLNQNIGL